MRRLLCFTVLISVLVSCSTKKQIEEAMSSGNYDQAIYEALQKLENNKDKKRKQAYIIMLTDAFNKGRADDLEQITHLKTDGNPELYKIIYEKYTDLEARQNAIKRIMPLKIEGETIKFLFHDYTSELVTYRYKTSHYLINKGLELLATNDKFNAREAYKLFDYVDLINPNFDNVRTYRQQAHEAGMDFVYVVITNQTQQIIPQHLEAELLDFNTYGLNQFWTTYHSKYDDRTDYDFSMQLQLKHINISPERFKERELLREREIIDGWKYLLDNNGNVAKDSLGNDIKIDKIINARAHFFEILQTKSSEMVANVVFTDLQRQKIIDTFIINSGFTFKNSYGQFKGDINALTNKDKRLLKQEKIPFPSDQQMVYDTAKDLKLQLKGIISPYQLRP